MTDQEAIEILRRCSAEIKDLRATIARMQPKADAYDNLAAIIGLLPRQSQAYGEDLAWRLDTRAEELEAEIKAAEPPAAE